MAPIKKLGIPIMKDCKYTSWNRATLMDKARMDNGAHILVVSGTGDSCIEENWDASMRQNRKLPAHEWKKECKGSSTYTAAVYAQCSDKEVTDVKTWHGEKTDFDRRVKPYLMNLLDNLCHKKSRQLQAFWQQLTTAEANAGYGTGVYSDMIEATTKSKINYDALRYIQNHGAEIQHSFGK